ncbi:SusC/RagA family TonB-linked outer membrane protein [Myroides marinus]|uniref:SusC/RagA family TonB-linked outer membrane protein n=1 Tax=Myroides marinus TaxID=703342 RepID=UPI002578B10B|nr:SusC/RagA family TonB-linked outer membrane protein [Myroides marinus]MDM1378262.1 SusC/RagA family TonB-linked outer membrane protein [Myroides marinus]MDM1385352.1 SusC/RagA family TonB-linked outer membrane protein [Myroides marinus]MDM1392565.1 SusC/RagA family TonB-linked outer membrane protein [Myroides marinus]
MKLNYKWIVAAGIMLLSQNISAQQKALKGVVTEGGLPLPGVTVMIKGTDKGTQTDLNGNYTLNVQKGDVLVYSFVGMQEVTHKVGDAQVHNVTMSGDSGSELDTIVVTAYGTQTKSSIAGSIAEVKAEEIETISSQNVVQGMVGKVAGVQIVNSNGMPGEAPTVRFRGVGSISASSAPLYVVDGVPFSGDVSSISNNDIETVSFLKDASAAALYGNRGANGVIIITTKRGKKGETKITFDSKVGFSERAVPEYDIIKSPGQFYEGWFSALRNTYMFNDPKKILTKEQAGQVALNNYIDGKTWGVGYNVYNMSSKDLIDPTTGKLNPNAKLMYQEDWNDYLYSNGLFTQTHMNISGGSDKTNYLFSIGYDDTEGYVVGNNFQRITSKVVIDSQVKDFLKVGANLNYSHANSKYTSGWDGGTAFSNPFYWSRIIAPIYPVHYYDQQGNIVRDADGNAIFDDALGTYNGGVKRPYGNNMNPVATNKYDYRRSLTDNVFGTAYLEAQIIEGLKFKYTVTGDLRNSLNRTMYTPLLGDGASDNGRVTKTMTRNIAITNQQLLTYNKWFGNHSIDVLLGHESFNREFDNMYIYKGNMLFPDSPHLGHAAVIKSATGANRMYAVEGYFSRLLYGFNNKYFVNASIRRDASSKFDPSNKWGTFYGVGAAWNISKENFMKDITWIDMLKLKASYGEQGNDNLLDQNGYELVNPYQDRWEVISTFDADAPMSIERVYKANRDITWETNINSNIGFEGSFFGGRLNIDAEYFQRKVVDMLFFRPVSAIEGTDVLPYNIGDMKNTGFELTVSGDIVRTSDFRIGLNANFTHYKNKILKLPNNGLPNNRMDSGTLRREEGKDMYNLFIKEFVGVNAENGNAQFVRIDPKTGERSIVEDWNLATQQEIGKSMLPKAYGGFGLDLAYKGFDLGLNFAYQFGGYGFDNTYQSMFAPTLGQNLHKDFFDTWTPDNTTASKPRVAVDNPLKPYSTSTLTLTKTDYLSLQNITLGYTFSNKVSKVIGLDRLKIYANVDNVALWSKRKGYDPRMSLIGGTDYKYSVLRTFAFGVNLQF